MTLWVTTFVRSSRARGRFRDRDGGNYLTCLLCPLACGDSGPMTLAALVHMLPMRVTVDEVGGPVEGLLKTKSGDCPVETG